jgi:hypothetical protein
MFLFSFLNQFFSLKHGRRSLFCSKVRLVRHLCAASVPVGHAVVGLRHSRHLHRAPPLRNQGCCFGIDCFGICAVSPMEWFGSVSVLHSVVSELVDTVDDNFQSDFTIATRVACGLLDVVIIWSLVGSSIFAITRCCGRD